MPGPLHKTVQEPTSQSMECKPGAPQDAEKSKRRSVSVKWFAHSTCNLLSDSRSCLQRQVCMREHLLQRQPLRHERRQRRELVLRDVPAAQHAATQLISFLAKTKHSAGQQRQGLLAV